MAIHINIVSTKWSKNDINSETSGINGQLIRAGLMKLLTPKVYKEVFDVEPEQYYLDRAIKEVSAQSDDHLFNLWRGCILIEKQLRSNLKDAQSYAIVDLAWISYTLVYNRDHPKEGSQALMGFEKIKKNLFKWL